MPIYGELHRFIPVLAHYRGYRVAELPVNHRPREHGRSRYGMERYVRGFLDLLTVTFMGRYRHRPLHLFGGVGLLLGAVGTIVLVYLTVLKLAGQAIGHRPLLTLGVLLVVVGVQLLSLGLVSELIASHHEERTGGGRRPSCTWTRSSADSEGSLFRDVRAQLPAERAGDLLPSRGRSRGRRAAPERLGDAAAQVGARARGRREDRLRRGTPPARKPAHALRRLDRGLSRPFRPDRCPAHRTGQAGALQSTRVAPRDPRRGPRSLCCRRRPRPVLRRIDRHRASARRPGRRRHGAKRAAPGRARGRCRTNGWRSASSAPRSGYFGPGGSRRRPSTRSSSAS